VDKRKKKKKKKKETMRRLPCDNFRYFLQVLHGVEAENCHASIQNPFRLELSNRDAKRDESVQALKCLLQ